MVNEEIQKHLDLLARYLLRRRDAILELWTRKVEKRGDHSHLLEMTRAEFQDHIPSVLNVLHLELRGREPSTDDLAEKSASQHGAHRWQQGFDVLQVIKDWGELHQALLEEIDEFINEQGPSVHPAMRHARGVVVNVINEGVYRSVGEYQRLQRLVAEARARGIERVLSSSRPGDSAQGLTALSHQLNGGLERITNAALTLKETMRSTPESRLVDVIHEGSRELGSLLYLLHDLARLEANLEVRAIEPIDAAQVLRATIDSLQGRAAFRVEYRGPVSLAVRGDREKIRRIVSAIILNLMHSDGSAVALLSCQAEQTRRWTITLEFLDVPDIALEKTPLQAELEAITEENIAHGSAPPNDGPSDDTPQPSNFSATPAPSSRDPAIRDVSLAVVRQLCELLDATVELSADVANISRFQVTLPRDYKK